jgi:hypothetical protein
MILKSFLKSNVTTLDNKNAALTYNYKQSTIISPLLQHVEYWKSLELKCLVEIDRYIDR